jgi:hypothetical protein
MSSMILIVLPAQHGKATHYVNDSLTRVAKVMREGFSMLGACALTETARMQPSPHRPPAVLQSGLPVRGVSIRSSASCMGARALSVRSLAVVWPRIDLEPRHITPTVHPLDAPRPLGGRFSFPVNSGGMPSINKPV